MATTQGTKTTEKELLICFCFAYFMKTKTKISSKDHYENWLKIFRKSSKTDILSLKIDYGNYLEDNYEFKKLIDHYLYEETNASGKQLVDPDHLIVSYDQTKKLFLSNEFLDKNKHYITYTQSDNFTIFIKNECIEKILQVFQILGNNNFKYEFLSSVDYFIVNKNREKKILDTFKALIIDVSTADIARNYILKKPKTYDRLIAMFLKSKDLIPVSHKMPAKNIPITIKYTGNLEHILKKINPETVDPYVKLVLNLNDANNKMNIKQAIEKLIHIDYNNLDMGENKKSSSWNIPITFKYKDLDPTEKNLDFILKPLPSGGSGSWNGQFLFDKTKATPWVAGTSPNTINPILSSHYSGYNDMMKDIAKIRVSSFIETIEKNIFLNEKVEKPKNKKLINFIKSEKLTKNVFNDAVKKLSQLIYLTVKATTRNKSTNTGILYDFFVDVIKNLNIQISTKDLENELENFYMEFFLYFSTNIRKLQKNLVTDLNINTHKDRLSDYYISLQMTYIILSKDYTEWLKQQIFFTLFGAISKRLVVGVEDDNKLLFLIKGKIKKDTFAFKHAPFLLIS